MVSVLIGIFRGGKEGFVFVFKGFRFYLGREYDIVSVFLCFCSIENFFFYNRVLFIEFLNL